MSRPSSNCSVMLVEPWPDCELIDSIPATVANCRSNGVATVTNGSAEFVHWRVSAAEGLCLQGFEGQSRCAPAYLAAPARLRWTDVTFSVLGYGTRGFEAPRPDLRPPPPRPR